MTFQRAPPDVNGFGVITWIPGSTRSFQPLMCFGLPSRTTKTTTESETIPRCVLAFQFFGTRFLRTSRSTSGLSERLTTSAGCPAATARAWSPDAPYDWLKLTPLPDEVFWKAEMILP